MNRNTPATISQWALWLSPLVIVPGAIFASLPWLKQQDDAVSLGISASAALFVLGYSHYLAARVNRGLDEVEVAGQRFASTKGMTIGTVMAVLVIIFPPMMNALVNLANTLSTGSPDTAVKLGITIGFMLVVIAQVLGTAVGAIWWGRRLRGPA